MRGLGEALVPPFFPLNVPNPKKPCQSVGVVAGGIGVTAPPHPLISQDGARDFFKIDVKIGGGSSSKSPEKFWKMRDG